MKLDLTTLDAELRQKTLRPLYVVAGEEGYLRRTAVRLITEAMVAAGANESFKQTFAAQEVDAPKLLDAVRAVMLFGGRTFVVVRDGEKLSKDVLEALANYAEKPVASATLVIDAHKIDGRSRFMKVAEKTGGVVECKALYANQLPSWINMEVRRFDKKISQEAARFLADMVGNDLGQLAAALDRVSLYVGRQPTIELKDVEEAVVETAQRTVFELCNALGVRKVGKAVAVLGNLLDEGQAPVLVLNMIARHVRLLIKAKEIAAEAKGAPDIAKQLGVHPFFAKDYIAQARNFSAGELRRFFRELSRCDRAIKSSRLPRERILEKLILELCAQKI